MPNIELVGFHPKKGPQLALRILEKLREAGREDDTVVSVYPGVEVRAPHNLHKPFIRLCSDRRSDFPKIVRILKSIRIKLDIELLKLEGFVQTRD